MKESIVLVTGANSGFGMGITLELANKGYKVIATMRSTEKQEQLRIEANDRLIPKGRIDVQRLDVTNQDEIDTIYNYILNTYGTLDILINNAGYTQGGVIEEIDGLQWEEQFKTNVFGVVSLTKSFIPVMRKNRSGKIINLGSISGRIGLPGLGPYAASKFALEGFSESLRLELQPFNVYTSLIEAGSFKTGIWKKGLEKAPLSRVPDYKDLMNSLNNHVKKMDKQAQNPQIVMDTVIKICETSRPHLRYPVGKGVKAITFLKSFLPWAIVERIVLRMMK
ncbi:short-chain dehydrogenase [Salipaludibacillus neizhouensis]|uniref:Short-chain dehydrogenase n=1 Tax=Salipaludibacillus neizhouensis TaxID=885475 RepID=A0A3A9KI91_9BACI|nr:SDR family oxidoreductase [Salipaludibacillus neizhouensis]RKL69293.1 short-chain dehydrogenase [Salipaludibacillus neizhouensis]